MNATVLLNCFTSPVALLVSAPYNKEPSTFQNLPLVVVPFQESLKKNLVPASRQERPISFASCLISCFFGLMQRSYSTRLVHSGHDAYVMRLALATCEVSDS